MTIKSGFFAAIETSPGVFDRSYTSREYADRWKDFIKNGVVVFDGGVLSTENEVSKIVDTMQTEVAIGSGWTEGYYYQVTAPIQVLHATADPTNPRIDRVVIELNLETAERRHIVKVITGTPAASPTAPALTRTATVYQISLAQVYILAGESTLNNAVLTDERTDDAVCGLASIRVGVPSEFAAKNPDIDEQSGTTYTLEITDTDKFIELTNVTSTVITIPLNSSVAFPIGTVLNISAIGAGIYTIKGAIGVSINGVQEAGSDESLKTIKANEAGVYSLIALYKRGTDLWVIGGDYE